MSERKFSLETYVAEQKQKLLKVSPKSEIRRVLGVFNFCQGACLDLALWVQLLQEVLKSKQLTKANTIVDVNQQIWEKVVRHGIGLCFVGEPENIHLMVDYSLKGCGYALFAKP